MPQVHGEKAQEVGKAVALDKQILDRVKRSKGYERRLDFPNSVELQSELQIIST